jgi:hypothetical protein
MSLGIALTQMWGFSYEDGFTSNVYKIIYLEIMPALLNFVSDCIDDCLIFFSWIGLNLHIIVLIAQGILAFLPSEIRTK